VCARGEIRVALRPERTLPTVFDKTRDAPPSLLALKTSR
jgi:hypothetical protein